MISFCTQGFQKIELCNIKKGYSEEFICECLNGKNEQYLYVCKDSRLIKNSLGETIAEFDYDDENVEYFDFEAV